MIEAKCYPASYPKVATDTSGRKKIRVTDTSKGDLLQKLLSNRNLLIITTTIDPRIDDRIATSGAYMINIERLS